MTYSRTELLGHKNIDSSVLIDKNDNHPKWDESLARGKKLSTIKKYLIQYYQNKET